MINELCIECRGKCCKSNPGILHPDDIEIKDISSMLKSENYAIDWWEGEPNLYFLRPAIKGNQGKIFHPAWGGECVFLKSNGCILEYDKRPRQCKELKPGEQCSLPEGKDKYAYAKFWEKISLEKIGQAIE